jgi:hypothetical protein
VREDVPLRRVTFKALPPEPERFVATPAQLEFLEQHGVLTRVDLRVAYKDRMVPYEEDARPLKQWLSQNQVRREYSHQLPVDPRNTSQDTPSLTWAGLMASQGMHVPSVGATQPHSNYARAAREATAEWEVPAAFVKMEAEEAERSTRLAYGEY